MWQLDDGHAHASASRGDRAPKGFLHKWTYILSAICKVRATVATPRRLHRRVEGPRAREATAATSPRRPSHPPPTISLIGHMMSTKLTSPPATAIASRPLLRMAVDSPHRACGSCLAATRATLRNPTGNPPLLKPVTGAVADEALTRVAIWISGDPSATGADGIVEAVLACALFSRCLCRSSAAGALHPSSAARTGTFRMGHVEDPVAHG